MVEVAAVILAAGLSTRFGVGRDTKASALFQGRPLVRWVAEAALASRARPLIVVTGHAAASVRTALAGLPLGCVDNPSFAQGMATSLQVGVESVPSTATGMMVLLADMPCVGAAVIDALVARFEEAGGCADAVVPVRDGRRGNPVLLGRSMFSAVASLRGDRGARHLLAESGRTVLSCSVEDDGIELDIDTPAALDALSHRR